MQRWLEEYFAIFLSPSPLEFFFVISFCFAWFLWSRYCTYCINNYSRLKPGVHVLRRTDVFIITYINRGATQSFHYYLLQSWSFKFQRNFTLRIALRGKSRGHQFSEKVIWDLRSVDASGKVFVRIERFSLRPITFGVRDQGYKIANPAEWRKKTVYNYILYESEWSKKKKKY